MTRCLPEDADAVGRVDVAALVEDRGLVGLAVAVGVFEDQDAIPFGPASPLATRGS